MKLNCVCNVEHWSDSTLVEGMRTLLPHFAQAYPGYPAGVEHRKHWEYAHIVGGLERLGAVRPDSWLLSVAGGHEEPAFYLSNHVRWMFLGDIYGTGGFSGTEARPTVLTNPDAFASIPYNRRRLVVQYMNALDLRHEDGIFDGAICLSSIEHFGGFEGARRGLAEISRVLKPGGIAAVTTECIVNGASDYEVPGLFLFSPATLDRLAGSVPGLEMVERMDYSVSKATLGTVYDLLQAVDEASRNECHYPHIAVKLGDRLFTSAALFFRKY